MINSSRSPTHCILKNLTTDDFQSKSCLTETYEAETNMFLLTPCKDFTICHALLTGPNIIIQVLQLHLKSLCQNLFLITAIHLLYIYIYIYMLASTYQPFIIPTDHSQTLYKVQSRQTLVQTHRRKVVIIKKKLQLYDDQ
jgi:hypothetical protein